MRRPGAALHFAFSAHDSVARDRAHLARSPLVAIYKPPRCRVPSWYNRTSHAGMLAKEGAEAPGHQNDHSPRKKLRRRVGLGPGLANDGAMSSGRYV